MATETTAPAVNYADVEAAARRIAGHAHVTPVITSRTLNEQVGAELYLKCENLQRAGAFKFRGAFNRLSVLTPEERRRGVVAFSSGNHAQAVALSSQLLGIPAVIVMPHDAPATKVAATRGVRRGDRPLQPPDRGPRGDCPRARRGARPDRRAALRRPVHHRGAGDGGL